MTVIVFISCVSFLPAASSNMVKMIFVFVGLFAIIFNMTTHGQDYRCFMDGRIEVSIQNDLNFTAAYAEDSHGSCSAAFDSSYTVLTIKECAFGDDVKVSLSFRNEWDYDIDGGKTMKLFTIRCGAVNESGVHGTVLFRVTSEFLIPRMSSIEPILDEVKSALYTDDTLTTLATRVFIGSLIVWSINTRRGALYPVDCTVYKGLEKNVLTTHRKLVKNGCSLDEDLVGDFTNLNRSYLIAPMYAFRFADSNYITIVCEIRICLETSAGCDFTCKNDEKSKRHAEQDHRLMRREAVRVSLLVEDLPSDSSTALTTTSSVRLSSMLIFLLLFWFGAVC